MEKKSLKFKLITGGILVVLFPLIIIGFFSVNKASKALMETGKSGAKQVALDLAAMTDLFFGQEIKLAKSLAVEPLVIAAAQNVHENGSDNALTDLKALDQFFATVFKQTGSAYEFFFMADANGTAVSDNLGGVLRDKKLSLTNRDYFQAAKQGKTNIGAPDKSKVTGKPIVIVAVPLKTTSGQFAGIFGAVIKLDILSDKITRVKIGKTGYPFMVDKKGMTIIHPKKEFILEKNLKNIKEVESIILQMLSGKTGTDEYSYQGEDKVVGFAPVSITGWAIGVNQDKHELMATSVAMRNMTLIVGGTFLGVAIFVVLLFARNLVLPIIRISEGLNQGAEQVTNASSEVSSTSQSLADGSSQQAASIEETSSSMEEISSMTKKNAENARHADNLMKDANQVVTKANKSMKQLILSMEDISKASLETSKIIKTIDEIAFQTNLLALNAAVEAARAGEAGAGFAVVADEVRNLAIRAADAAKNTADMIEGTVKKVNEGSELVATTNDAFSQVADSSGKVGKLVAEITQASKEQSDGIEQVNINISEMDKVVQQNAANAEESAAAAEEMNAQAEQLKDYVRELVQLVNGTTKDRTSNFSLQQNRILVSKAESAFASQKRMQAVKTNEIRPNQVIPFDDEFKDF
ncbi:methyl-accepting chemotaxis protein [Desulfobacula phenolica]|uniref:Methyl-accepting chemotaxis sensory transducer with Cache sensor n=1 Tax=Desulfobacula phenolica TaxID=90732 RepID=A0A1H2DYK8_9BACT|nr:methyl-accepting chemotaxis protein [Desulfobacula phenolica]SDT87951.1 methyl-accepting chemotaxis sensory transducer with Cache sensor [Desulfobacula phenolica]